MINNICVQEIQDTRSLVGINIKIFYLTINFDKKQYYNKIIIIFTKFKRNEENIYNIKGICCEEDYEHIKTKNFQYYIENNYTLFKLYEIYLSNNLKKEIQAILKKTLLFLKKEQSESKLTEIVKYVRELKKLQYEVAYKQLYEFLHILEDENYD